VGVRRVLADEPVRVYTYGVALALLGLGVAAGVVDRELADAGAVLVGAVLTVPAVEAARARVTPVRKGEQLPPEGE